MEREQPGSIDETANPKMGEAVRLLEQGLDAIRNDESFKAYLKVQARFWDYSYANTLLIATQRPDATRVTGYRKWQELGRQVKKGERGIKIFYPRFGKAVDAETGEEERRLLGFGVGSVFDIAQTEGEPLPQPPTVEEIDGSSPQAEELNRKLGRFLIEEGATCKSEAYQGRSEGFYHAGRKEIVIRKKPFDRDPLSIAKTKTLVHEGAHFLADHNWDSNRPEAEMVAESVAFVVMHHYGFDTGDYSFYYLANWKADREKLRDGLAQIQQVSQAMIRGIESVQNPDSEDYWEEPTSLKGEETQVYPGPFLPPSTA